MVYILFLLIMPFYYFFVFRILKISRNLLNERKNKAKLIIGLSIGWIITPVMSFIPILIALKMIYIQQSLSETQRLLCVLGIALYILVIYMFYGFWLKQSDKRA